MTAAACRLEQFQEAGAIIRSWNPEIEGFYAILRLQSRIVKTVGWTAHVPASADVRLEEGMGLQLFASHGRSSFVSADSLDLTLLEGLFKQGCSLLAAHPPVERPLDADFAGLEPLKARRIASGRNAASLSVPVLMELTRTLHERLYRLETPETRSMGTSFVAADDEWRIFRTDGTDVHFNVLRTSFAQRVTLSQEGDSSVVRESDCGQDDRLITDPERLVEYEERVRRKIGMGLSVLRGKPIPAGHYNIILDAGMAKGLAHEAFGHACESDQVLEGSALTRDRMYLLGEVLAPEGVSIVDGPLEGDWADQPFSANGFVRQEVAIVQKGRLAHALADVFSGPAAGLAATGAERAARYDSVPLPRMTNIRLEVADAIPWDKRYGLVEPQELYQFLLDRNVIQQEEAWLYLEGYRGGQVNTMTGDYVFNCTAIHKLEGGAVTTHPPAVFSGQILQTLAAVRTAVGPLELMRQGMCGKDGQRVPSSGGGHLFTLFNATEGITIGGC